MHPKNRNRMKKTLVLLSLMLMSTWMMAQTLYAPLQQFIDVCNQEKEALRVENPDFNKQYRQLFECLVAYSTIPMRDGSRVLHPSNTCADEPTAGHIIFSPSFVADYMDTQIPDPALHSIPYDGLREPQPVRGDKDSISIYFANVMLCPDAMETFQFRVSAGEQQLVVIAEDDTPLELEIHSEAGTSLTGSTQTQGVARHIWSENSPTRINISVKNPASKHVSFVIAVH